MKKVSDIIYLSNYKGIWKSNSPTSTHELKLINLVDANGTLEISGDPPN